jgi:hypothetical protein
MQHKRLRRPAHCQPGSITDAAQLGERLRVSRERLASSPLANHGQAWRLWAACADATLGYAREADQIYLSTLARTAGVHRTKAGPLLRRFDELEVFGWTAAPRGSHGISELSLPHVAPRLHEETPHVAPMVHEGAHVAPQLHEDGSSCSPHGSRQSNESFDVHNSVGNLEDGELETSEASHPSRTGTPEWDAPETRPARCPIHDEELVDGRCVECFLDASHRRYEEIQAERRREEVARRETTPDPYADLSPAYRRHFGLDNPHSAFDHDERTGDGIGDDERSRMRWRAANPNKVRARRQRDHGGGRL